MARATRKVTSARRSPLRRVRPRLESRLESTGPQLVVATYNVHTCVGIDRRYDPERVAAVLRELNADIIGLQEVEQHQPAADQWRLLGEALGYNAIPGHRPADQTSRFGNAILTRFPVLAVRHIDLSVTGCPPRGAIDADLAVGDRRLRVIATHLGLRAGERRYQIGRLLDLIAVPDPTGMPILMLGDLNEWRGRRGTIRALDRALGRAPAPRTFPAWCPILRLDRIYAGSPAVLAGLEVHRSGLARLASDHLPLRAVVGWP